MADQTGFERYTNRHILKMPPILWVSVLLFLSTFALLYWAVDPFRWFFFDSYRAARTVELICPIQKGIYATTGLGVNWFYPCLTREVTTIQYTDLIRESFFAGIFLIPIGGIISLWMIKKLEKEHPAAPFNGPLQPELVEKLMEKDYPHITYFRRLNLVKDDIKTGAIPSGMAVKDWIIEHGLIEASHETSDGIEVTLNKSKIYDLFLVQLGQTKIEFNKKIEPCKRALMLCRQERDPDRKIQLQKELDMLTNELDSETVLELFLIALAAPKAYCMDEGITKEQETQALQDFASLENEFWSHFITAKDTKNQPWYKNPLDSVTVALDYLERYGSSQEITKIIDNHAYMSTILVGLYDKANIAPADVGWLRAYNRRVWYIIQNTERPTHFIENAATACHFSAEKANKGALSDPEFINAFSALKAVCNQTIFTREEININTRNAAYA